MKCPICNQPTGEYAEECVEPGTYQDQPYPLYQISYKGQPEYLPPRCLTCFNVVSSLEGGG